jgi:FSR family fosmidomycin resistance protein-like MFS transporter
VVSALGIPVQLSSIAVLVHLLGVGYLVATIAGVAAAVAHNFLWHVRWTWHDRALEGASLSAAFARFALANGAVSMAGNLVLMAGLVAMAGLPVVPANLVAIAVCGVVNFELGDRFVFRRYTQFTGSRRSSRSSFPLSSSITPIRTPTQDTALGILAAISLCHGLNDLMQSVLPAVYPILKQAYRLDFGQIGLITFANQATASLLQPFIGTFTDARPKPYSLPIGMGFTLAGLVLLSVAPTYGAILAAVALVGIGSSVFHPESSRVARLASGGRHGFAQSFFQVGGNIGSSTGPLLAAFIVLPFGQRSIAWFAVAAFVAITILVRVGSWYGEHLLATAHAARATVHPPISARTWIALGILVLLVFSKNVYLASLSSYYTFYLIQTFSLSVQSAQLHLFMLLGAVAAGTFIGGPIGDRIGRKHVIWVSILGVLPFTLLLPHANLFWTEVLTVIIGLVLASAFPAIIVFAQELVPGRVGAVSGVFFGFAFGAGGLGAAMMGQLADATSIGFVFTVCSFLPAIGLLTWFLPDIAPARRGG